MENATNDRVLESLNSQLIQKNKEMEQLLARVAHELLTPVTSLMMTSDELLDHFEALSRGEAGLYNNEQLLSFTNRISRNGKDLKNQALNILTHFSAGSLENKTVLVNLTEVLKDLVDSISLEAKNANVTISTCYDAQHSNILSTRESIETIFRNIVSNALKFTVANEHCTSKHITIRTFDSNNSVTVSVVDSGIGIPENYTKNMFQLGKRGDNAANKQVRGYGLGLTTVKKLVDSLGGNIDFSSKVNEGTTATIVLPHDQDEDTII